MSDKFLFFPAIFLGTSVMTYCDGGDLYERIKRNRGKQFHETQVLHWFVQMALGLHFMHENHILHRDLKTQNVFLLGNGRLVLGDLGIAKVMKGTADFAKTCIGTPYYMSPELFKNKPYNHKSDVWALGCVLYEMITLKHAFDASSLNGLAVKILRGRFRAVRGKFSRPLRDLVGQLLALNPSSRPDLPRILRMPIIKRHIVTFIKDIIDRPYGKLGAGTMVVKAAAINVFRGNDLRAMTGLDSTDLKQVSNLKMQLERLGMGEVFAGCLGPAVGHCGGVNAVSRPSSPHPPRKMEKKPATPNRLVRDIARKRHDQVAALRREEERKLAVERALQKLREEREIRAKARRRRRERKKMRDNGRNSRDEDLIIRRARGKKRGNHAQNGKRNRSQSKVKNGPRPARTRARCHVDRGDVLPQGRRVNARDVRQPQAQQAKHHVLADKRRVVELDQWDRNRKANGRMHNSARGSSCHDGRSSVLTRLKVASEDNATQSECVKKEGAEGLPQKIARKNRRKLDRLRHAENERLKQQKSDLLRMRKRLQKHQDRVDRERIERESLDRQRKGSANNRPNLSQQGNAESGRQRKVEGEALVSDTVLYGKPERKSPTEVVPQKVVECETRGKAGERYRCPPTKDAIAVLRGLAMNRYQEGRDASALCANDGYRVEPSARNEGTRLARKPPLTQHPLRRHQCLRNWWREEQIIDICQCCFLHPRGSYFSRSRRPIKTDGSPSIFHRPLDRGTDVLPGPRYVEESPLRGSAARVKNDRNALNTDDGDNAIRELEDLGVQAADPSDEEDIDAREEELKAELDSATSRCATLKATLHVTDAMDGTDLRDESVDLLIDVGERSPAHGLSNSAKMRAAAASAARRGSPRATIKPRQQPQASSFEHAAGSHPPTAHDNAHNLAVGGDLPLVHLNPEIQGLGRSVAPAPTGKPGGLRERISIVRRECIESLGQRRFDAAYDLLKKYLEDQLVQDDAGQDDAGHDNSFIGDPGHEEHLRVLLEDILGDDMAYWGQIDHLIFMEECL